MALDLAGAQVVTLPPAPVADASAAVVPAAVVNVAGAQQTVLPPAPVGPALPPISAAGVTLTNWILVIIGGFLVSIILVVAIGEGAVVRRARENERMLLACGATPADDDGGAIDVQGSAIATGTLSATAISAAPSPTTSGATAAASVTPSPTSGTPSCGSARVPDPALARVFLTHLEAQQVAFRSFWLDVLKIVLLNVLLPVLTALLGYIFGSSR